MWGIGRSDHGDVIIIDPTKCSGIPQRWKPAAQPAEAAITAVTPTAARPTLIPRYYGGAGGYYGAYAAGYPGDYYGGYANNGVYANGSYVTGRPTLIPRRYAW